MRERKRLLYVAMTRAESWLIVAAEGEVGQGEDSWYGMVSGWPDRAAIETLEGGIGPVGRYSFGDWPDARSLAVRPWPKLSSRPTGCGPIPRR